MNTDAASLRLNELPALHAINLAGQLAAADKHRNAIVFYKAWLASNPGDPMAYAIAFNLGVLLKDINENAAAEQAYRWSATLNPNCLEAQFNLGSQLERMNRPDEAIAQWQAMLDSGKFQLPHHKNLYLITLNNLGRLLEVMRNYPAAEEALLRSLATEPDQNDVLQHLIYLRQKQCAWPTYLAVPGVSFEAMLRATGPLSMLAAFDSPERQLERAQRFTQERVAQPRQTLCGNESYNHSRLRIGYLSSDFCMHPVAMLTVELFELHDRSRVEVYGFCWSRDDGSALRKRVIGAFDHYIPIGHMSDEEAARHIRSCEIDVLVDLHGLTLGSRPGILPYRAAPVQVTYLGFPGTTGLPGVDYVLVDRFLLPEAETRWFSEKPLYLHHCFQVSDRKREAGPTPTRAACGLPEKAFVFCCFNNNYKFTPEVFATWMRILRRVPGSVLWLLADTAWAQHNLTKEAVAAGIAKERLVFAGRVSPANYLARYRAADLFLDTFPFGAGTTANDALWLGLPVLTRPGRTFASRMAGSLLHTLGLPELIAADLADYEERAVALGNDPERAARLRRELQERGRDSALFDMPAQVRSIEDLLLGVSEECKRRIQAAAAPKKPRMGDFNANYALIATNRGPIIEVVSATRRSQESFWKESALGQSLRRLAHDQRLVPRIAFENRRALPAVYNERIEAADPADLLVFVHDDVWLDDYFWADRVCTALAQYDVIGVAGSRRCLPGHDGWAFVTTASGTHEMEDATYLSGMVGHGKNPGGELTVFGTTPSECELLDGVFLATWKRTLQARGVRFDPRFHFHFYDLDFCRSARAAGLRLATWPICLTHQSEGVFNTGQWREERLVYRDKWKG